MKNLHIEENNGTRHGETFVLAYHPDGRSFLIWGNARHNEHAIKIMSLIGNTNRREFTLVNGTYSPSGTHICINQKIHDGKSLINNEDLEPEVNQVVDAFRKRADQLKIAHPTHIVVGVSRFRSI